MANEVDKQIEVVDGTMTQDQADKPDYERVYQVYENTRIPVSNAMGKVWKVRWKECKQLLSKTGTKDRWDEVIRYYQNDQGGRNGKRSRLSDLGNGKATGEKFATENVVFSNVSALVPATYAKNPDIEITSQKADQEKMAELYERLIDTLFTRKVTPGVNLKPKMRRAVVTTTLTNLSYIELSYVQKEDSSENATAEIEALSKKLAEATDIAEIQEIEGQLLALEKKVSFLSPSGPRVKFRRPDMVYVDPNSEDPDLGDADYVIIGEYVRTDFIRAVYGKKAPDTDDWMSIYKPTHILSGDSDAQGHDDEINNFTLLNDGAGEHEKYGYKDKEEFDHNCRTLCWYVWDKVTRRVYLFNDADWSWPIWVWDDPYHLSRFYPIFPLAYNTDPIERIARSEVMYYLDQQDEINEINNERARMRHWAMSKVFVNSSVVKDATKLTKFLNSDSDDLVYAIDIPEGKKLSDVLGSFPTPSTQFEQLFETKSSMESINRMSSVTPVLQNAQYKTNTTNKAIESYESSTQMRLDEKIDAIEDMLADLGRGLLEMCVQFMTRTEVEQLLGAQYVQDHGGWIEAQNVDAFNQDYSFSVVGGSTLKPTAKVKKEQAMQLGQILGQFANASPMLVIVMLKMLQRAFSDDVVITPEEWDTIVNATSQQMQRGSSAPGEQGGGQPGGPPAQGQPPQGAPQQADPNAQAGGVNEIMTQVEQVIDSLPPQAKQALGAGIAKGIPLKQLVQQITQAAQAQTQQRPQ